MRYKSTRRIAQRRLTRAVLESLESRTLLSQTIYVDANPSITSHDGTGWNSAYADMQTALAAAAAGDQIRVADGTYKPTTGTDRTISFILKNGVSVTGGYAGYGAANPDARDVAANPTILSGDIGTVGSSTDNSYHVVVGSGTNSTAVLDGFTITAGRANGSSNAQFGSGMYNSLGSPTVINCTFEGNTASRGGGIYDDRSSPILVNDVITSNTASTLGGGVYNTSATSTPMLVNCTLTNNTASTGGGIYNSASSSTLTNCIIWSSGSSPIFDSSGTSTITYSDIQGGYAGVGNLNSDPQFVRTRWAGPDGVFGTADDDSGDFRLRSGSPALNAGSNSAVPTGITTDLAGNPRVQDGIVDLGAYEGAVSTQLIYVDLHAVGVSNGTSWADAFTNLPSAILAANDGDTIWIADGTYKPTTSTDRTFSFGLKRGVSLYGGYAGYGSPNPDTRDIVAFPTILSGNIGVAGSNTDNSYHVLTAVGIDGATVDGVTITLGYANGSLAAQQEGGGLYVTSSSLTLRDCIVSQNTAAGPSTCYGGGMYNNQSSSMLVGCTFIGNLASASSTSYGNAMYNNSSSCTLTNCTFSGNGGSIYYNDRGGGIYNASCAPSLTNCTFSGNAAFQGAGMYNESSSPTVNNCMFSGNSGVGGGIYNYGSSPTLTNCNFIGNTAGGHGGGMYDYGSSPTLNNCTFTGNTCGSSYDSSGGGVYNESSSMPTLINCVFSENEAHEGGGMYNIVSSPILTNCIFLSNSASYEGGGLYDFQASPTLANCTFYMNVALVTGGGYPGSSDPGGSAMYNYYYSTPKLTNCIIWGCGDSPIYNGSYGPSTPTITYSDIEGDYAGVGNFSADPLFVRSPWAGPDGAVGTADDTLADLRLRTGSPALNAGSNADIPAGVTTDLAGNPRIQEGIVDLGAYEGVVAVTPKLIYVDLNATGAGNGTSWADAYISLSPAIMAASNGDTIRIADGTYKPTTGTARTISFVLKSDVSIYGGYAGFGAADPNLRNTGFFPTVLSGNIGDSGVNTDNSYHVVTALGVVSATVDGTTIASGYANGDEDQGDGAGLFNHSSFSLTLSNCIFIANTASSTDYEGGGGGMYNSFSSPTVNDCTFTGNMASSIYDDHGGGGGMYNFSSSPTLTNCIFSSNSVPYSTYYGGGGGMYNDYFSSPILNNCTFTGNTSYSSPAWEGGGGGMFDSDYSAPMLTNCIFSGNTTPSNGGGIYNSTSSSPTFIDCVFNGNTSSGEGGGMYNESSGGSTPTLINCVLSGNAASTGGAVYDSNSSPKLTNCIVWGNGSSPIFNSSGTPTITYSDVQGFYSGVGNINADPLFVDADGADNIYGTADDNLRLPPNSPCLDSGSNAAVPNGMTSDLEGNARFIDISGVHDPGAIVDMGAYERQLPLAATGGTFVFDRSAPSIKFTFNNVVVASTLAAGDVMVRTVLTDGSLGGAIDVSSVTYDPNSESASFTVPATTPDGNYRATLLAGSVNDTYGVSPANDFTFDFFVLAGDANHDGVVNVADLATVAKSWQQSGKVFSQGDFNYDGNVDLADLKILADNWGKTPSGASMVPSLGPMLTMLPLSLPLSSPPSPPPSLPPSSPPPPSVKQPVVVAPIATTTDVASVQSPGQGAIAQSIAPAVAWKKTVSLQKLKISGSVFNDLNRDKKRNKAEKSLSGWRVFIDKNNDGIFDDGETSVLTDAKGNWTIGGLVAGTYKVRLVPKAHWVGTTPKSEAFKITLGGGATATGNQFGEAHKA